MGLKKNPYSKDTELIDRFVLPSSKDERLWMKSASREATTSDMRMMKNTNNTRGFIMNVTLLFDEGIPWTENPTTHLTIQNMHHSSPKHDRDGNMPTIAFLFMTTGGIHEHLWKLWFPPKDPRYSIFVHSVPSNTTIPLGPFFCPHAIPSVRTSWYKLHHGMMQLLQHAHDKDKNAQQFLFVSETSIPLVSFDEVYHRLIQNGSGKSRFCFPSLMNGANETHRAWQYTAPLLDIDINNTRKAEMWSSLTRSHVSFLLMQRETLNHWNKVFRQTNQNFIKKKRKRGKVGAPDECLFPTLLTIHGFASQFVPCEQSISECCTTHVTWSKASQAPIYVDHILLSDTCQPDDPCSFSLLYETGLRQLAQQGYLFLRKATSDAHIMDPNGVRYPLDALLTLHRGRSLDGNPSMGIFGSPYPIQSPRHRAKAWSEYECPAPKG